MHNTRRQFLKHLGAGGAIVSMPAFLSGCGVMPAVDLRKAPPPNPFLAWFGIDQPMMARVMSELTARGADHAELFFQHRRVQKLELRNGQASTPAVSIDQGAGLRVIVNGQVGFAHTTDLSLPGMLAAARDAAKTATGAAVPSPSGFELSSGTDFYPVVTRWADVATEERLSVVERVDQAIRARGEALGDVVIDWSDMDERVVIATPDGRFFTDHRPLTRLSVQVTATRRGDSQPGFASISARQDIDWYSDERIEKLANDAVDRALIRFDARRPPLGEMPVVLAAGAGGIVLHEALGHALEADFNGEIAGPYAGRVGKTVAAPVVTVIDDATMTYQRGALTVDDEGTPGQRNVLIENGVLNGYLHDKFTAFRAGVSSTGSGRRESFQFGPMPRMTCTRIANGDRSRAEVLAAVEQGIWAQTFANGRVDPLSGDFSFEISTGWLIEKGKATMPVRDVRVSGNGPEMLQRVTMLGNDGRMDDAGWTCGKRGQRVPVSHGMPTTLVSQLTIST